MHLIPTSTDILWTVDGDLFVESGDVKVASAFSNEVMESAILRRLQSTKGDWKMAPLLGANLVEFAGWPNTRETGALIKSRIVNILTEDLLLKGDEVSVDVYPNSLTSIVITIVVNTIDPDIQDGVYIVGFTYDMRDNKLVPRIVND